MKNHTYIWILAIATFLASVSFFAYEMNTANIENDQFLANLKDIAQTSNNIEKVRSFYSIENSGRGWFNINGYDANPVKDIYYTVAPVHVSEFASTTDLSPSEVYFLTDVFKKYPFVGRIRNDVSISGTCADERNVNYSCTALEFYLPLSLLTLWSSDASTWYSSGYMYVPFELSASDQSYLHHYFTEVKEVGPDWYSFSGQHL
jgi:hypothetical protein